MGELTSGLIQTGVYGLAGLILFVGIIFKMHPSQQPYAPQPWIISMTGFLFQFTTTIVLVRMNFLL